MTDNAEPKLSKLELLKKESRQLRGTLPEEIKNDEDHFTADACQLLKHHGSYQQDNRDLRRAKNEDGTPKGKAFSCMIRSSIPGGRVTADQFLAHLDICNELGEGHIRITTRQGFQVHGVLKKDLKATIRAINDSKLTTIAACGDVCRSVMCCPAPHYGNNIMKQVQEMSQRAAVHFRPKTTAYAEMWLTDDDGEKEKVAEFKPVEEPIYGEQYLPRKFKIGFALPEDNCIDIYAQDLGYLAVVENDEIIGYNVLVGGGMGMTPSKANTFPAVAKRMTFVTPDNVLKVGEAIMKVQRDFGNREDRKVARMKYLIANWGLEKFKAKVEEYYGQSLPEPHVSDVTGVEDHVGWHDQGDGKLYLGVNVENGRIVDTDAAQIKTGFRKIIEKYKMDTRLTAFQSVILCDISPADKDDICDMLAAHGMKQEHELTLARRYSIACPALPMCGLAVTESERIMPECMDDIEKALAANGLQDEKIVIRMTGCPNGCARPYTPDIGLVGKSKGKYTLYLGGNTNGTQLAFIYEDKVPLEEIGSKLSPLFSYFTKERTEGESFGDFCSRKGLDDLAANASTG